jgi:hypothetical protein
VSRVVILCVALAACLRIDSTGKDMMQPDAPSPPPSTSLEGAIPCGAMQCPSQSLCTHWSSGIDAGVPGNNIGCSIVPTSCRVYDCDDLQERCAPCISDLCSSGSYGYGVSVIGRDLYCPGV